MEKKENKKKNLFILVILILLNLFSPWFWVLVKNPADFKVIKADFYQFKNETRLYEINTMRGEATKAGLGILGKLTINKFTWSFKEILARAEESFDPYFLFFKGDLNVKRSTWVFGPIFWVLLPMACCGYFVLSQRLRIFATSFPKFSPIIFFALIGAFFEQHYFSPSRIPLFLIFNWLAAFGLVTFFQAKVKLSLKLVYLLLVFFEISRFVHDFYFHYPGRILSQ